MAYTAGITDERNKLNLFGRAGGIINPYRIVVPGTDPDEVIQASDYYQYPVGISGDASENGKKSYEENDSVVIYYSGIVYLKMSGTGARGNRVCSDANGKGQIHDVDLDDVWVIGMATQAWVDGDIIPIEISKLYIFNPVPD